MEWTILAIGGLIISALFFVIVLYLCYKLINIDKTERIEKNSGANKQVIKSTEASAEIHETEQIINSDSIVSDSIVSGAEEIHKNVKEEITAEMLSAIEQNNIAIEQLDLLDKDKYSVIKSPILSKKDTFKAYGYIVVGNNGIFIIEPKLFEFDGQTAEGVLIIEDSPKWHIAKTGSRKHIDSPTRQIKEQMDLLESIIAQGMIPVHPILALCNEKLSVDKRTDLFYDVVKVNDLVVFIEGYNDSISSNDKMYILSDISRSRVN